MLAAVSRPFRRISFKASQSDGKPLAKLLTRQFYYLMTQCREDGGDKGVRISPALKNTSMWCIHASRIWKHARVDNRRFCDSPVSQNTCEWPAPSGLKRGKTKTPLGIKFWVAVEMLKDVFFRRLSGKCTIAAGSKGFCIGASSTIGHEAGRSSDCPRVLSP